MASESEARRVLWDVGNEGFVHPRRSYDLESGAGASAANEPRASSVEKIAIPVHLLASADNTHDWTPGSHVRWYASARERTDRCQDFDIVRIAQQLRDEVFTNATGDHVTDFENRTVRSNSVPVSGLAPKKSTRQRSVLGNRHNVYGLGVQWRKTSLPSLKESASSGSLLSAAQQPHAVNSHAEPAASSPSDTMLFKSLSSYNLSSSCSAQPTSLTVNAAPYELIVVQPAHEATETEKIQEPGVARSETTRSRRHKPSIVQGPADDITSAVQVATTGVTKAVRRTSIFSVYEKAELRGLQLQRKRWAQFLFEYVVYLILLCFVYFVLIGRPIWNGAIWWLYWIVDHKFAVAGTWSVTIGMAIIYAFTPLLILFEKEPPMPAPSEKLDPTTTPCVHITALLIPCYKSAKIIGPTLEAASKIFPPHHTYVIANGNSATPLDNTEEVCSSFGVNHIWSLVSSKIVAQFVGCYAAKQFTNLLLIDDDCALPPNFPIVSGRMSGKVKCIGYTIKSVGPGSSKGTLCQQAQDLEYKISGLQRALAGKIGSATLPHGAISLWDTEFLSKHSISTLASASVRTGSLAMSPVTSAVASRRALPSSSRQKVQVPCSLHPEEELVADLAR
ncbi:hypothetical protein LTR12_016280 [Friedmanniomyces endolithicus]|nr:hypothetical protein LTR12_016280 [Friedmanniomyces endolithicus]